MTPTHLSFTIKITKGVTQMKKVKPIKTVKTVKKKLGHVSITFGFCDETDIRKMYYKKAEGPTIAEALNKLIKTNGVTLSDEETTLLINALQEGLDNLDMSKGKRK